MRSLMMFIAVSFQIVALVFCVYNEHKTALIFLNAALFCWLISNRK